MDNPIIRQARELIRAAKSTSDAEALTFIIAEAVDTLNTIQEHTPCTSHFLQSAWHSQSCSQAWH